MSWQLGGALGPQEGARSPVTVTPQQRLDLQSTKNDGWPIGLGFPLVFGQCSNFSSRIRVCLWWLTELGRCGGLAGGDSHAPGSSSRDHGLLQTRPDGLQAGRWGLETGGCRRFRGVIPSKSKTLFFCCCGFSEKSM